MDRTAHTNMLLISNENFNPRSNDLPRSFIRATVTEVDDYRRKAFHKSEVDKCLLPPVLYKGRVIPRGRFGERILTVDRPETRA